MEDGIVTQKYRPAEASLGIVYHLQKLIFARFITYLHNWKNKQTEKNNFQI